MSYTKYNRYRWCVVPTCKSTRIKTPEKLFIKVPDEISMRNIWLKLASRDPELLSKRSVLHFCEDHFDLENDMENYIEYKIMGSVKRIRMKPNCKPSKFEHETYRPNNLTPALIKSQKISLIQEIERTVEDKHSAGMSLSTSCESGVVDKNPFMSSKTPNSHDILERKILDEQPDYQISYAMELSSEQFADSGPDIPNLIDLKNIKQETVDESLSSILSNSMGTPTVIKEECMDIKMDIDEKILPYQTVPVVKTENIEAINECEQRYDMNSENWKIKTEEVNLKEEHSESTENTDDCEDRRVHKNHNQASQEFNVKKHRARQLKVVTCRDQSFGQVKMFQCHQCDHQSKYKSNLRKHLLRHKTQKDIKCHHCAYKTIKKSALRAHLRRHESPEEFNMFKCQQCDYQSKHISNLCKHLLRHKTQEDIKCHYCAYKTMNKSALKAHLLCHKSPEEVNMFKCDQCDFQTIYRYNLNCHLLLHKNPEEVIMFKCHQCDYQSKYKFRLRKHLLRHKSPEEVIMFKCHECDYQSKYASNLRDHLLRYKTHVDINKCHYCAYKTMSKSALKAHILSHGSPEEVNLLKCDQCDFQTIHSDNLKCHLLLHKNPTKVNMFNPDMATLLLKAIRSVLPEQTS